MNKLVVLLVWLTMTLVVWLMVVNVEESSSLTLPHPAPCSWQVELRGLGDSHLPYDDHPSVVHLTDTLKGMYREPPGQVDTTNHTPSFKKILFRNEVELRGLGDSYLPYDDHPSAVHLTGPPKGVYQEPPGQVDAANNTLKKILFWNENYTPKKHYGFGFGREPFIRAGCRINTCFTTSNRTRFPPDQIDALIWNWRSHDKSFPTNRWPHTRYVMWMVESASYPFGDMRRYNHVFNWTQTYRLDSDFPNPYGFVYRRRQPLPPTHRNYAEGKTKLIAWFVSNCYTISGREHLVDAMEEWISVDKYGSCSYRKCDKSDRVKCNKMLSRDYKFYLAFENSLCRDYATEKFFGTLNLDVIPVVYGLGNYSSQAPPHSYIDALSFSSVKALTDYLLYLHHNDTAYNEYFRWKQFHVVIVSWAHVAIPFCQMCERLHTDHSTKTYDIYKWFIQDSHCRTLADTPLGPSLNSGSMAHIFLISLAVLWCVFVCGIAVICMGPSSLLHTTKADRRLTTPL